MLTYPMMALHATTPPPEAECGCIRCWRRFGPYTLEAQADGSIALIDPAGRPSHLPGRYWEPRNGSTRRRKGPRTGTRLENEFFEGRSYLRVICKCGRNEKLGREELRERLFDEDGVLRVRDGVLYI
jgi:hypothetical protein